MRILVVVPDYSAIAQYRALGPMGQLTQHGHEVNALVVVDWETFPPLESFQGYDVVFIWRIFHAGICRLVRALKAAGIAVIWDNDDNMAAVPRGTPTYERLGGARGQREWAQMKRMIGLADAVTTPSDALAELYRRAGQERVEVLENFLAAVGTRRRGERKRVVVGWVAGYEHAWDARRLGIEAMLRRLLERRPSVHVACLGVSLDLRSARYEHRGFVDFNQLPEETQALDIGIAPLADIEFNRSRSNVKLKEYAAAGVPWLASPVGPYVGMGEEEGGRLVPDNGWYDALVELVDHPRQRKSLGRRGHAWAQDQTIDRNVGQWERILVETVERVRERATRVGV